jgi:hypothetical protein
VKGQPIIFLDLNRGFCYLFWEILEEIIFEEDAAHVQFSAFNRTFELSLFSSYG